MTEDASMDLSPKALTFAAGVPIAATVGLWMAQLLAARMYPGWMVRSLMKQEPAPFLAGDAPALFPLGLVVVALVLASSLVKRGHGWLAAMLVLYYAAWLFGMLLGSWAFFGPGFF
jgi:hypothetical protein